MRGRKPKPTAIKQLAGNPGKRPLNDAEAAPALLDGIPYAPRHLTKEGQAEWRRIVAELDAAGLVTVIDLGPLEGYCAAYGRWVRAETELKETGLLVRTVNGNVIQNPILSIANKALDQMMRAAAEFGMTPSARSRVSVARGAGVQDIAAVLRGEFGVVPGGKSKAAGGSG